MAFPLRLIFGFFALLLFAGAPFSAEAVRLTKAERKLLKSEEGWPVAFRVVQDKLRRDGFQKRTLSLITIPPLLYDKEAVTEKMMDAVRPPGRRGYIFDQKAIDRTKKFLKEHAKAFAAVEKEKGVSAAAIASLLWIETKFRENVGTHNALNVFMSLAAMKVPEFGNAVARRLREEAADQAKEKRHKQLRYWKKRATKKIGPRWYLQLKDFLKLAYYENWDAHKVKSSWAGAMGIGQFMPSTAIRYLRKRGGGYHQIDLWDFDDTIKLVATKLHKDGWRKKASVKKKKRAIYLYNHSKNYRDTIWDMHRCIESDDKKLCDELAQKSVERNQVE